MLGIFLDLETSGLDHRCHRVLELAFRVIDLFSTNELASLNTVIHQGSDVWSQRDLASIEVNGFTYERLKEGIPEEKVSEVILETFSKVGIHRKNSVFICQNPSFDRPFFSQLVPTYRQEQLQWPYHWLDLASMHWAVEMRQQMQSPSSSLQHISLSKDSIAQSYHLPREKKPHRAMNGVDHLILCYWAVMNQSTK